MRRWIVCWLTPTFILTGCTTWATQHQPPIAGDALHRHDRVRVMLRDSSRLDLRDAVVSADSVIGQERKDTYAISRGLSREEITDIVPRRVDPSLTALTIVGTVGGVVAAAGLVCALTDCIKFDLVGPGY